MSGTVKNAINSIVYILIGNAIYGLALYFLVTWLAGYSLLLAYLANLLLIFTVIALDEYAIRKTIRPENIYAEMQQITNEKQKERYLRLMRWALTHYMSFKTFLFVFYIVILIFAQILKFYPSLAGENIAVFISVVEYSVIILLALKDFGEELSKDRSRAQTRLEEFDQYLTDFGAKEEPSL